MNYKRRGLRRRINQSQLVKILQQKFKDDFFARISERLASEESPEVESSSTFRIPPLTEVPKCEDCTSRIFPFGGVFVHNEERITTLDPSQKYVNFCVDDLEHLLRLALKLEDYNDAALIRDELKRRSND